MAGGTLTFPLHLTSITFQFHRSPRRLRKQSGRSPASGRPGHSVGRALPEGHVQCGPALTKDIVPVAGRTYTQATATGQAANGQIRSHSVVSKKNGGERVYGLIPPLIYLLI